MNHRACRQSCAVAPAVMSCFLYWGTKGCIAKLSSGRRATVKMLTRLNRQSDDRELDDREIRFGIGDAHKIAACTRKQVKTQVGKQLYTDTIIYIIVHNRTTCDIGALFR